MSFQCSQWVDIHTHILPGLDDGPKTLEESANLAGYYRDLGVTHLIATPHYIPGTAWAASIPTILEKIAELQQYLQEREIYINISPGMEIAFHKRLPEQLEAKKVLPLGDSNHYLLEPSFTDATDALFPCLDTLLAQGHSIILAHPERIPALAKNIQSLVLLVGQGLKMQVNTGSLLGKFGPESQRVGRQFLDLDCVHYLASDAHGVHARRPPDRAEWAILETELGADVLERLCCINPARLLAR